MAQTKEKGVDQDGFQVVTKSKRVLSEETRPKSFKEVVMNNAFGTLGLEKENMVIVKDKMEGEGEPLLLNG